MPFVVWIPSSNREFVGLIVPEILRRKNFGVLAWNCLFTPLFGEFLGNIFPRWRHPSSILPFDFRQAITLLDNALEHFNTRGSGFVLEYVKRFVVSVLRHRPLHGSTYIPTPSFLVAKRCVIHVQNFDDSKCFLWSALSALHEPKHSKKRVSNYVKYESTLHMTGINYPVVKVLDAHQYFRYLI